MTLLEARDVDRTYPQPGRPVVALEGVTLDVEPGELVVVTGASGSGKSTLLSILGLLDRPSRGTVRFRGEPFDSASAARRAGVRLRAMGFVFQDFLLVRHLSALDNVRLPLELAGEDGAARAEELLARVDLAERRAHLPHELSRGEMQRVALARALANRPEILLADEPTANLDRRNADRVFELLRELHRDDGLTLIVATHGRERVEIASRVLELEDGRLVAP